MKNKGLSSELLNDYIMLQVALMLLSDEIYEKHKNLGIPVENALEEVFEREKKQLFIMKETDTLPDVVKEADLNIFENAKGYIKLIEEITLMFVNERVKGKDFSKMTEKELEPIVDKLITAVKQKALYYNMVKSQN